MIQLVLDEVNGFMLPFAKHFEKYLEMFLKNLICHLFLCSENSKLFKMRQGCIVFISSNLIKRILNFESEYFEKKLFENGDF